MNNQQILNSVRDFITRFFEDNDTASFYYHNLRHTEEVVYRAAEIAASYNLAENDLFILSAAAWFHDCGYLTGPAGGHEARGIEVMSGFMAQHSVSENVIDQIRQSIASTAFPTNPQTRPGKILCDADSYHFGTDRFFVSDELVKKEVKSTNGSLPPDWDKKVLQMLQKHAYYTGYCQQLLEQKKQENIELLQKRISGI